jgi:UDPglucose--hexose-1-phosphate uridylyltransferase
LPDGRRPHPHGQIWATATVPNELAREQASLLAYRTRHGHCLLCEYLATERRRGDRVVFENDLFTVLVPHWAVWPFETMIVGRRHAGGLEDLDAHDRDALADALKRLTTRYDNLFETPFPYSMGFHQRSLRRRRTRGMARARALLPTAAAVRRGAQVHGRIRAARHAAARPDPGGRAARLRALSQEHYRDRPTADQR